MATEPMRAVSTDDIRRVVVVAPTQLMKTEFAINAALYFPWYGDDALFVEPDMTLCQEMLSTRVRPALKVLGAVDTAGVDNPDDKKRDSKLEIGIPGGGTIRGVTPQMKTGLVARSAPVVIFDELDKMEDPTLMLKAEDRITTYGDMGKIIVASTPTLAEGPVIWREWEEGSRGVWHGRCPHCGEHVSMDWDVAVKFEKDAEGLWRPDTARLVCQSCGAEWDEADRLAAAYAGMYIHDEPEHPHRTFRVPGPAHLWRPLAKVAKSGADAYREGREGGEWRNYETWINHQCALPWRDDIARLSESRLKGATYSLGARGKHDRGELDRRVVLVTAATDTGGNAMYTEFVGWGVDVPTQRIMAWGLGYHVLGGTPEDDINDPDLWRAYEKLLESAAWRHPYIRNGLVRPSRVFIDCGFQHELVKTWCNVYGMQDNAKRNLRSVGPRDAWVLPVRGFRSVTGDALDLSRGMHRKKGAPPLVWPLTVYVEVERIKDEMWEPYMRDNALGEGLEWAHKFPSNPAALGYTDEWFRDFASERRVPHRTKSGQSTYHWEHVRGLSKKNEAWDIRVYNTAAVMFLAGQWPMRDYLFALALREAVRAKVPEEEVKELRAIVNESRGYTGGGNVVELRP